MGGMKGMRDMKNPDSSAQLSLLPTPTAATAQVIKLPPPDKATAKPEQREGRQKSKQQRNSLWYALHLPQLSTLPESRQDKLLNELAALAQNVSSGVSIHPQALICEVRSSLKYFGGIDAIHERLQQAISKRLRELELPAHFLYAAAPTVTGSLLLARSGHNALVYRKDNLRSALGRLPTRVLRLDKEQNRRLYNMGVRYLRDIWRLPADDLRKRFGSEFINRLNKALGKAPEPVRNYLPPPAFITCYDLPHESDNLERLLPVADEMLAQLCDFLRRRDLSAGHLLFSLRHEKRESTEVNMRLRRASRSREHLMPLLETHFDNLSIPAPVIGLGLEVRQFDAFMSRSNPLLSEDRSTAGHYRDSNLDQFMEQLQARLGDNYLRSIGSVAEHCPEYACRQFDYSEADQANPATATPPVALNPRPLWLLEQPLELVVRHGKLYHRKPVTIISGPERIETFWWSGTDIRRDYYVAREQNGSRLWIFRERRGKRNWYLHGLFA